MDNMTSKILIALSILYGMGLALMSVFDLPGVSTVAIVGALMLGAGWIARALFSKPKENAQTSE
ncbi:MAG TPA: hypothetical protein H9902_12205 [Candidatus Stackebrandtia faecavium]|nr:hypothetical protein [Candidatus Stackebrandtia faecavium]